MNTLKTMCKCHGLSGSCTAKTCVKTASGLRLIGNAVKTVFNNAKKVEPENQRREGLKLVLVDARTKTENSPRKFGKSPKEIRETPTKSELLYSENSPSFCERDDTLGTLGVSGRICSKNTTDINSCRLLCCGQGYNEFWMQEESQCECKFKYCCSVQCKKCSRRILIAKCR